MRYSRQFPITFAPVARPEAVVRGPQVRFTVLTSRLLRLEFSPRERFEDRPSQVFWYRRQPVPAFTVHRPEDGLEIETEYLHLRYRFSNAGFSPETLTILLKQEGVTWHYGQGDPGNLLGTARTLDNVKGAVALEPGLLSRSGWAVVDDSQRLVFDEDGWLVPRQAPAGNLDLAFFGYGHDYQACLDDYAAVAGSVPLLPRWALGNWWSRYWAYSAGELLALMDAFQEHQVPLSVCIVDMDWHITETGNASRGWTGYTWNRALFPDPPAFIAELHRRGLKTALNLHPAAGIYPHEEQYAALARRLGLDPASGEPIPFDIADPAFTRAYFELLHHPYEAQGVDFWWIDWQQGTRSSVAGLDPLWWLNHLHFYDLGRNGDRRPFIFSRWGGLGSHRYPIGFSGDSIVSWESLAFQPPFTATAANVAFGWWSHDIGGHMGGIEEPELYTRWVQFGLFSPILRLHSTKNPFHERRPWGWDAETERITRRAMQLRHAFIPYLYTMSWRDHCRHQALVRPMYHLYPEDEQAYQCPGQYLFGSELLAAPYTTPAEADTGLSRQVVWLPPGEWFDFFRGYRYPGDGWQAVYGGLEDIPVFARAGAIVPVGVPTGVPVGVPVGVPMGVLMGPAWGWGGVDTPEALQIALFPGADNRFELYEDDGGPGSHSLTPLRQEWGEGRWLFAIEPAIGQTGHLPPQRRFSLRFHALGPQVTLSARLNGEEVAVQGHYDAGSRVWQVDGVTLTPQDRFELVLAADAGTLRDGGDFRLGQCRQMVHAFRLDSWVKQELDQRLPAILDDPALLRPFELDLTPGQTRALVEVITGAGFQVQKKFDSSQESNFALILWNNRGSGAVRYKLVAQDLARQPVRQEGPLPAFAFLAVEGEQARWHQGRRLARRFASTEEWLAALPHRFRPELAGDLQVVARLEFGGVSPRSATLRLRQGQFSLEPGGQAPPDFTISASEEDWLALINGDSDPMALYGAGRLAASGDLALALPLLNALEFVPQGHFPAGQWKLEVDVLGMVSWKG